MRTVKIESVGKVENDIEKVEAIKQERKQELREDYIYKPLSLLWSAIYLGVPLALFLYIVITGMILAIAPWLTLS